MGKEISEQEVRHLAKLARLHVSTDEVSKLQGQLGSIFEYIERLSAIDIEGVEPLSHVHGSVNVMRPDLLKEFPSEKILHSAPDTSGSFVRTPLIVDSGE